MGNVTAREAVEQQTVQQATPWLWDTMAPLIERVSPTVAVWYASYFAARAMAEENPKDTHLRSWTTVCKVTAVTTCAVACLSNNWKIQSVSLIGFAVTTFALGVKKYRETGLI